MGADGSAVIRAVLWLQASTQDRRARESWTTLRLRLRPEGPTWKITGQQLLDGQTVIGRRRGFTDITGESGITFESGHNPMLTEPEWFPTKFGIMKYSTAGVAASDYDNDGWCDIFFCDGEPVALPEQPRRHVRGRPPPLAARRLEGGPRNPSTWTTTATASCSPQHGPQLPVLQQWRRHPPT
jgi:hypothetical protein